MAHIKEQSRLSLGSYGRPRMSEELKEIGLNVGHRRVGRLMRQNGISVVRTPGAGTLLAESRNRCRIISWANRRVVFSSSASLQSLESMQRAPFDPPYGTPTKAHFYVIRVARASTSSTVQFGASLMPPLEGLWWLECADRQPVNVNILSRNRTPNRVV